MSYLDATKNKQNYFYMDMADTVDTHIFMSPSSVVKVQKKKIWMWDPMQRFKLNFS